ncbi:MAG: Gp49 family protein [Paracoccaceae bacterium]
MTEAIRKVTDEEVDAEVVAADYHVFPGTSLTVCVLQLRNGYTVTGESACADPRAFDAELGKQIARANARSKVWGLLAFRLCDEMAAGGSPVGTP